MNKTILLQLADSESDILTAFQFKKEIIPNPSTLIKSKKKKCQLKTSNYFTIKARFKLEHPNFCHLRRRTELCSPKLWISPFDNFQTKWAKECPLIAKNRKWFLVSDLSLQLRHPLPLEFIVTTLLLWQTSQIKWKKNWLQNRQRIE